MGTTLLGTADALLAGILVLVALFLLFRSLVLWYFCIPTVIKLLERLVALEESRQLAQRSPISPPMTTATNTTHTASGSTPATLPHREPIPRRVSS